MIVWIVDGIVYLDGEKFNPGPRQRTWVGKGAEGQLVSAAPKKRFPIECWEENPNTPSNGAGPSMRESYEK